MRKRLKGTIVRWIEAANRPGFDPATLGDPLALTTEWTPLQRGGANFKTHKLVELDAGRLEFRASVGAKLMYLLMTGIGIVTTALVLRPVFTGALASPSFENFVPMLFGVTFILVGIYMYRRGTLPVIFDTNGRCFWRGRQSPHETFNRSELKYYVEFDQLHALQILREYIRSNKSSYYSYELNIVKKDGTRMPVIDHGDLERIRADAETISRAVGCVVWDAAS